MRNNFDSALCLQLRGRSGEWARALDRLASCLARWCPLHKTCPRSRALSACCCDESGIKRVLQPDLLQLERQDVAIFMRRWQGALEQENEASF